VPRVGYGPYGITRQKAGTVPPQHRGRLTYQMTVMPQNCPLMNPLRGEGESLIREPRPS